jgi:hypothetical protein
VVVAVLPEVAEEAALFVWVTVPPLATGVRSGARESSWHPQPPLLEPPMPIGSLLLDGSIWTALEAARLVWSVWADWSLAWVPAVPPQPQGEPAWFWRLTTTGSGPALAGRPSPRRVQCRPIRAVSITGFVMGAGFFGSWCASNCSAAPDHPVYFGSTTFYFD